MYNIFNPHRLVVGRKIIIICIIFKQPFAQYRDNVHRLFCNDCCDKNARRRPRDRHFRRISIITTTHRPNEYNMIIDREQTTSVLCTTASTINADQRARAHVYPTELLKRCGFDKTITHQSKYYNIYLKL